MSARVAKKDYSLTGRSAKLAHERGIVDANWYTCHVPREELKELMRRKDYPAIRDTDIFGAGDCVSFPIRSMATGGSVSRRGGMPKTMAATWRKVC